MNVLVALTALLLLGGIVYLGVEIAGLEFLFGVIIPYAAVLTFLIGLVIRVISWARTPVPFRITTTCGQQRSLSWISPNRIDNPSTTLGVLGRMALEIFLFRSLFRNTRNELREGENRLVIGPSKWLWLMGLAFHWSFLIILLRHLRLFVEPVPQITLLIQSLDGFFQVGVPVVYSTSLLFVTAATLLFVRRIVLPQVRYLSLPTDYFPLFLLISIAGSGIILRHFIKIDIVRVKEVVLGLMTFRPEAGGLPVLFYFHLFLVSVLLAYFPFSKLVHMAGVVLSPTRNLANNNRRIRHVNPWDYPVKTHTYQEYEEEFRGKMIGAGIPVEEEDNG
ncbi:MAG: sulfate reduction electron transfer complex DsrMKJOP subunit DsrM [Acidobacteriota bacterium]|nr:MAG: sulfate reduction electron transfer complex DsrMKJOP subunit DsrM [Acidobacteriota bacterium]